MLIFLQLFLTAFDKGISLGVYMQLNFSYIFNFSVHKGIALGF